MITPTFTQYKKRPVCASLCTATALLLSPVKTKDTLNTSGSSTSQRLKKNWCQNLNAVCDHYGLRTQNVTCACFLWRLHHQLKLWSAYLLSPSRSVRGKVCFCPRRCLVCNGSGVSHPQENKALRRVCFLSCGLLLADHICNRSACAGVRW